MYVVAQSETRSVRHADFLFCLNFICVWHTGFALNGIKIQHEVVQTLMNIIIDFVTRPFPILHCTNMLRVVCFLFVSRPTEMLHKIKI